MIPSTLHIAPHQQGESFFTADAPLTTAESPALVCHNLRRESQGVMCYAGIPRTIATVGGIPLLADRRALRTFLLRQEDDGSIIVEGSLEDHLQTYTPLGINLGNPGGLVLQAVSCGRFVVLRLRDGSLSYIYYDSEAAEYVMLGALPSYPRLSCEVSASQEMSQRVDAVTFRKKVADPREGLDADRRAEIGEALSDAWERLRRQARDSGYWLQPVRVRLAYRLPDRSVVHISDPLPLSGDMIPGYTCGGRVTLAPLVDKNGDMAGTDVSLMTATGYRLRLSSPIVSAGVWDRVLGSVEVWVSEEGNPTDKGGETQAGVTSVSGSVRLVASFPMRPAAALERETDAAPCAIVISAPPSSELPELSPSPDMLFSLRPDSFAGTELVAPRASCLCGHDGFLHVATSSGLITCTRDNPLCIAGQTPGDWSDTGTITPQIWGGGAYTRQILYLSHGDTVTALAHDAEGRHTNCRTICEGSPADAAHVAQGEGCVYMLLRSGALVRLEGTREQSVLTGVHGCSALAFCRRFDELWLMPASPAGHCVVMGSGRTDNVSTRDNLHALPLPGDSRRLMRCRDNGLVDILAPELELLDSEPGALHVRWMGEFRMPRSRRLWRTAEIGVSGSDVDMMLSVGQSSPVPADTQPPFTLTRFHVTGTPRGLLRYDFRPGATQYKASRSKGRWTMDFSGRLRYIYHAVIEEKA